MTGFIPSWQAIWFVVMHAVAFKLTTAALVAISYCCGIFADQIDCIERTKKGNIR